MAASQQANQPDSTPPKKIGKNRFAHTQNTKFGMGDNYGTGIKAKVGKMREEVGFQEVPLKKLKQPPRSLA
jgi:hypothetical protein